MHSTGKNKKLLLQATYTTLQGEEFKLLIKVVDIDDSDQIQAQRNFNFEDADGIIAVYDINDSETWVQIEGLLY